MGHARNPPEARQPPAAPKRKPPARQPQPLGFGQLFGQALARRPARRKVTDFQPVDVGQNEFGRKLLSLVRAGKLASSEQLTTLLSGVPALKKFPVGKIASSPGLGQEIVRLVAGRAKQGQLVSEEEFLGLIEATARPRR